MNTRRMLDTAKAARLSPDETEAHIVWALISQTGRGFMTVGEVGSLVQQTSGYKPSTYQVNRVMAKLYEMGCVDRKPLRRNAKGEIMGWMGIDSLVGLLFVHAWRFAENDVLFKAIWTFLQPVQQAVIDTSNRLYHYNQALDLGEIEE